MTKRKKDEVFLEDDYEDKDDSERLSVWDAAQIWASNGKDEDYTFGYTEEELVSCDTIGMTYGSLFDATQTMVNKIDDNLYEVMTVAWYDNENSYTSQLVKTSKYFAGLIK